MGLLLLLLLLLQMLLLKFQLQRLLVRVMLHLVTVLSRSGVPARGGSDVVKDLVR